MQRGDVRFLAPCRASMWAPTVVLTVGILPAFGSVSVSVGLFLYSQICYTLLESCAHVRRLSFQDRAHWRFVCICLFATLAFESIGCVESKFSIADS